MSHGSPREARTGPDRVVALAKSGATLIAIRELRLYLGLSLAEARDLTRSLAAGDPLPAALAEQLPDFGEGSPSQRRLRDQLWPALAEQGEVRLLVFCQLDYRDGALALVDDALVFARAGLRAPELRPLGGLTELESLRVEASFSGLTVQLRGPEGDAELRRVDASLGPVLERLVARVEASAPGGAAPLNSPEGRAATVTPGPAGPERRGDGAAVVRRAAASARGPAAPEGRGGAEAAVKASDSAAAPSAPSSAAFDVEAPDESGAALSSEPAAPASEGTPLPSALQQSWPRLTLHLAFFCLGAGLFITGLTELVLLSPLGWPGVLALSWLIGAGIGPLVRRGGARVGTLLLGALLLAAVEWMLVELELYGALSLLWPGFGFVWLKARGVKRWRRAGVLLGVALVLVLPRLVNLIAFVDFQPVLMEALSPMAFWMLHLGWEKLDLDLS